MHGAERKLRRACSRNMHAVFAACAVITQAPSVTLDIDSVAWQVRSAAWRITSKCSCQAWCNCNTLLAGLSILVPPQTSAAGRSVSRHVLHQAHLGAFQSLAGKQLALGLGSRPSPLARAGSILRHGFLRICRVANVGLTCIRASTHLNGGVEPRSRWLENVRAINSTPSMLAAFE